MGLNDMYSYLVAKIGDFLDIQLAQVSSGALISLFEICIAMKIAVQKIFLANFSNS